MTRTRLSRKASSSHSAAAGRIWLKWRKSCATRVCPADLIYLSFAESAFSNDGDGPWQLSKETARRFGLVINEWIDERRDPIKSTRAAAEYLAMLHDEAGADWRMTLVAWNNGDARLNHYLQMRAASYQRLMATIA